ncbi:MAG: TatD family hydrolase [Polyangiaceae bacterium]
MFDSHCHLGDIDAPLSALDEARKAGVSSLLCCGYDLDSNRRALELRRARPGLAIAIGLHPWYVEQALEPIVSWIEQEGPIAIGEIGLDGYERDKIPPIRDQLYAFEAQLDCASRLSLPVTIHSRRAVPQVLEVLAAFPTVRGVLHSYTGSIEQVESLLGRGWMIGVGGAATRPSAHKIRRMVKRIPIEAILLETDAPAIGLEGVRPPFVRPVHLVSVAHLVADLRGEDLGLLVAQTNENASRMFRVRP